MNFVLPAIRKSSRLFPKRYGPGLVIAATFGAFMTSLVQLLGFAANATTVATLAFAVVFLPFVLFETFGPGVRFAQVDHRLQAIERVLIKGRLPLREQQKVYFDIAQGMGKALVADLANDFAQAEAEKQAQDPQRKLPP